MINLIVSYGAFVIGQSTKQVYMIYQNQIVDSFPTGTRAVPNYLISFGDTFVIVNSGGFSDDGSIAFIRNKNIIYELLLPSFMNPMEAVKVNNKIYFTDFGDNFNDKIYVVQNYQIIDSIKVYKRPSSITYCFDYIFSTSTGINSNYSYDDSSFVHKINPSNNSVLNLKLRPNANGVKCDNNYVYVMTSGTYDNNFNPLNNSTIYKINPLTFQIIDSTKNLENVSSFAVGNNYILAGVWKFDSVKVYKINKNNFSLIDSFKLNYGGLGGIDFDGEFFKFSLGGFTSGPNVIYALKESDNTSYYFIHHNNDVGSGFIKGFISSFNNEVIKNKIENGIIYFSKIQEIQVYNLSGRKILHLRDNKLNLRSLNHGVYIIKTDDGYLKILK